MDDSLALHEAAHAVAAHVRGVEVFDVALDADGRAVMTHDTPDTLLRAGEDPAVVGVIFGVISCAGAAAAGSDTMSGSDNRGVEQGLWLSGVGEDFYVWRAGCMARAKKLVDEHRDKIESVAAALMERGRLHGDEFRQIVAGGEQ